jgi:hypothetical protein
VDTLTGAVFTYKRELQEKHRTGGDVTPAKGSERGWCKREVLSLAFCFLPLAFCATV